MKALCDINLKISYRSSQDDLVADFFVPCLKRSTLYRRTAGYFSSSGLAVAAKGIAALASNGGKMRLVVSPELNDDDIRALNHAKENPQQALVAIVSRSMIDIEDALINDQLNALAWLSANGHLELKLAMRTDSSGNITNGIFHEKTGIFTDNFGNSVSFNGSVNETAGGLVNNFESLKAFCSWGNTAEVVEDDIQHFDELWNGNTKGTCVVEFSKEATQQLKKFKRTGGFPTLVGQPDQRKLHKSEFRIPPNIELREYQKEAIRAWSDAKGKGIFSMATGSGKTLTALTLACKVAEKNRPFILVVVCPFVNLCKQWKTEMSKFGLNPTECYDSYEKWYPVFSANKRSILIRQEEVLALVVTNATYVSGRFQAELNALSAIESITTLLIVDEVHNFGSEEVIPKMLPSIPLRLGLSATPTRHYDEEGTDAIRDYFGGIVYEYTIGDAIYDRNLCHYKYYPVLVELTECEHSEYITLTEKIGAMLGRAETLDKSSRDGLTALLGKRSRLLASAANKLPILDSILTTLDQKPTKSIFYCGDGSSEDLTSNSTSRQVDAVVNLLRERHHLSVQRFTYKENSSERERILEKLRVDQLDGVVAVRCLDEGIDLPDMRVGFIMASSSNPRQFIQRRGRLLRNAPGKDFATIYDFVVLPAFEEGGSDHSFNIERNLIKRELERIIDFCKTADNGHEELSKLLKIREQYNLLAL
jgi:DNA phosphorothioation system restriction enzyme